MIRRGRAISLGLIVFWAVSLTVCLSLFAGPLLSISQESNVDASGPARNVCCEAPVWVDAQARTGLGRSANRTTPASTGTAVQDSSDLGPPGNTYGESGASEEPRPRPTGEFRGLWVLRNTLVSRAQIDYMLRQAEVNGINALFVQVRGRGDALYDTALEPRSELLSDVGFDPLAYVIERAHGIGLEVHAWLNTFLVWSAPRPPRNPFHVILARPDWVHVRADGRSLLELSRPELEAMGMEGVFISAGNPEVREHLRAVVRELVERYDLDGIHLDYIRYPSMDVGYDAATRTEFMRRYGVDPLEVEPYGERIRSLYGDAGARELRVLWAQWRASGVTELVRAIHSDLAGTRPSVTLSAAVLADVGTAATKNAQDWPSWLETGILDFAVPMCYSASTSFVKKQAGNIKDLVGAEKFYAGLAIYNQSPARVVEKVRALRRIGLRGFCFFCYDPEHSRGYILKALRDSVFRDRSRSGDRDRGY